MSNSSDKHQIEEIDCLDAIDNLYAYLDGELNDQKTRDQVRHHLSHCRSCYTRSELEGALSERIRASGKQKTPESLQQRLRKLLGDF
jgi:anti-sigma factor (TIGR02949 family)